IHAADTDVVMRGMVADSAIEWALDQSIALSATMPLITTSVSAAWIMLGLSIFSSRIQSRTTEAVAGEVRTAGSEAAAKLDYQLSREGRKFLEKVSQEVRLSCDRTREKNSPEIT